MAKTIDPNAPKPEGAIISPARGESLRVSDSLPSSMEAALQRYGSVCHRVNAATVLDQAARPSMSLNYESTVKVKAEMDRVTRYPYERLQRRQRCRVRLMLDQYLAKCDPSNSKYKNMVVQCFLPNLPM